MKLFNVLSRAICSKNQQSNEVLSQEEYKDKFYYGEEFVKREYFDDYITQRLAEEFDMKFHEKAKCWCSEWKDHQRFVVELYRPKGTHIFLKWGYNYDFIPDTNKKNKLIWHRTDNAVIIHLEDAWYNHIEHNRDQERGFSTREFYNPRQCPVFQYEIPTYTSDMDFALKYIESVVDKNIPLMKEWIEQVKTVDDAIDVLNDRVMNASILHVSYMHYIRAFLYAKNKKLDDAMLSIKLSYKEREVPMIIIEKLKQLVSE